MHDRLNAAMRHAIMETTYRMYRVRDFEFVTVSTNMPDEEASVMKMLEVSTAIAPNPCNWQSYCSLLNRAEC
jgi:hypothetical protein